MAGVAARQAANCHPCHCEFLTGRRADPPWMKLTQFVARSFYLLFPRKRESIDRRNLGSPDFRLRGNDGWSEAGVGVSY